MRKKSKRSKRTTYGVEGVRAKVRGIESLINEGHILSVDPSCISASSSPGYAIYKGGELIESGTVTGISPHAPLEQRLQFLGKCFREEFETPDILVIEHIVPGGKFGSTIHSTIRASGAIIGSIESEHVVSISPLAWQKYIEKTIPLGGGTDFIKYKEYKELHKSDSKDAEMIGQALLAIAKENLGE